MNEVLNVTPIPFIRFVARSVVIEFLTFSIASRQLHMASNINHMMQMYRGTAVKTKISEL